MKKENGPAGVWNKNPVSKTSSILPPPSKIEWLYESCLLPTANQKQEQTMASSNKNAGRKACVDLWATLKALKTTGSSIETRLLSVRTCRTGIQEYFKQALKEHFVSVATGVAGLGAVYI